VLFDLQDQAYSVVAITRFEAVGSGKDGQDVRMTCRGQFVFQQVDGEWRVVSFKVLRDNEVQVPSTSAGASPSESPA
jgi:ketosteroid isomerase-like protein